MTVQDLQMLYDLAKCAPIARAEHCHDVSALFHRVDEELALQTAKQAVEAGQAFLAAKTCGVAQG